MPDREAFVAAIAASPADDLPRLVFADWLDEHGEPERAEFIRTQIRWHHADIQERKQLDIRAGELFREHWLRWLGPFLRALDPHTDHARRYVVPRTTFQGFVGVVSDGMPSAAPVVPAVTFGRGFVQTLTLKVADWAGGASLAEAFAREPVALLGVFDGLHSPHWARFTDPILRRVSRLVLTQRWAWHLSAPNSTALLSDPHLAGVRDFSLVTQTDTAGDPPVPAAWLELFVRSPLAYRLTGLHLSCVNEAGVAPLCRPGRLHLERLHLGGRVNADGVRRLGASELAGTVRELTLHSVHLDDAAAGTLARDGWGHLTRLQLSSNELTAAVLPALASSAFTPQLKALDLSGNPLFTGDERDMARLQQLGEALDPERLERLNLTDTGLSHVPDFLAERFGDRVRV